MLKYLALAVVAVVAAMLANGSTHFDRCDGLACGFAIGAGLCVVAAAIAESKENDKDKRV
jgi:uncharacterized membrane protein YgaE (UPF0421/DUF939 family)